MVGPSSSHTAGAVRIGYVARTLLGSRPVKASVGLHGSFAATGTGHGTDRALIAGLLGMRPDDMRIPESFQVAEEEGLDFVFEEIRIPGAHPNTAVIHAEGEDGRTVRIQASSLGGGRIMIDRIGDTDVHCTGEKPSLIIRNQDSPGMVAEVTRMRRRKYQYRHAAALQRAARGKCGDVLETDQPVEDAIAQRLRQVEGILEIRYIPQER